MPHTKSAKKVLRKSKKTSLKNKHVKREIKTLIKQTKKSITSKSKDVKDLIKKSIKKLDKAAQKGALNKNVVSRKKSRLIKAFNKSEK